MPVVALCQQDGCYSAEVVLCNIDECREHFYFAFYCPQHAKELGYCLSCGYLIPDEMQVNGYCSRCLHEAIDPDYDHAYLDFLK